MGELLPQVMIYWEWTAIGNSSQLTKRFLSTAVLIRNVLTSISKKIKTSVNQQRKLFCVSCKTAQIHKCTNAQIHRQDWTAIRNICQSRKSFLSSALLIANRSVKRWHKKQVVAIGHNHQHTVQLPSQYHSIINFSISQYISKYLNISISQNHNISIYLNFSISQYHNCPTNHYRWSKKWNPFISPN